jgi:hypothetical protein
MEIDTRFPTKLDTVSDAPEPFRSALLESLPSGEPVRLLVHAPAFTTEDQRWPATVFAVTNDGWLVASENEEGGAALEKSDFSDTLFVELTSIFLFGELKICFAAVSTSYSVKIKFATVEDEPYREAIDLILAGMDPALGSVPGKDRSEAALFEGWPMKIRNEAQRFSPKGQRFLAALQWPAIFGGHKRQLVPHGALLITERELVAISEEKEPSAESTSGEELKEKFGGIITFVPRVRLSDFHVSHQEDGFDVLALELHAAHGGEKLEIFFPSNEEAIVRKAMEQLLQ